MRPALRPPHLACIGALMWTASACSGASAPASTEPASLAPGLYEISVSQSFQHVSDQ